MLIGKRLVRVHGPKAGDRVNQTTMVVGSSLTSICLFYPIFTHSSYWSDSDVFTIRIVTVIVPQRLTPILPKVLQGNKILPRGYACKLLFYKQLQQVVWTEISKIDLPKLLSHNDLYLMLD